MTLPVGVEPGEEFFCARCRDVVLAEQVDWDCYDGAPDTTERYVCVVCSGAADNQDKGE